MFIEFNGIWLNLSQIKFISKDFKEITFIDGGKHVFNNDNEARWFEQCLYRVNAIKPYHGGSMCMEPLVSEMGRARRY